VTPGLEVLPNDAAAAERGAEVVADRTERAVHDRGRADLAVSGGTTPGTMFASFADRDLPWARIHVWQVDERVVPADGPDRNVTHLRAALGDVGVVIHPMPVDDADLEAAAARYAASLPPAFDLVHLGLGADGHTASLVPRDPVLEVIDRDVAVTEPYRGHRRMTLTFRGIARGEEVLWLVTGEDKRDALAKLLAADPSVPAGRVAAARSTILVDRAALPDEAHAR
jgi:6-phosphogluconolactonase